MPRTKQPRKGRVSRESSEESDSLVRDFERLASQRIHKMEADMRMRIRSLENSVDVALSRLPADIRKLTLGELLAADVFDDDNVDMESAADSPPQSPAPATAKAKKKTKRVTAASDDGYATECTTRTTTTSTHVSRINTTRNSNGRKARAARSSSSNRNSSRQVRATRSISRNGNNRTITNNENKSRNDLLKTSGGPPKTSSKFKTPSMKAPAPCFNTVTPKVKPNTPMNILRRPRDGEMVLSMQGSPLLVSSIVQERTANINVPLHNGNIISLLPNAGLRLSHMPALDHETMQQLKTLKGHIDMVIGSK